MTFFKSKSKSKLLGRRAACTDSTSPVACNDTNTSASAEEPNTMEQFLNNASSAVSSAVASVFQEAVSMADDMHTIIIADIDEESVKEAQDEEQKTAQPVSAMQIRTIEVKGSPATATFAEPMQLQETISCETRGDESNAGQPASSRMEVKESPSPTNLIQLMTTLDLNEEQPTNTKKEVKRNSATLAKLMSKLHKKEKQPTNTNKEAEGSPATLAKLMTKLDKKEKQIVKLEQQIIKTEHEVVETKKSIRALAAKFRGVLEGDDDNKVHDKQTRDDLSQDGQTQDGQTRDDQSQSECGLSSDDLGLSYDELTDDESEWDDEERDDAIDVALRYTRSQLSTVNKAASKAIFPLGV